MPIAFEQNVQTKQLALCSKGNQICKFFKNKIGSLRAHNFPDIGIKKKNLSHLIKIMSQESGIMGEIHYFTKMFLTKFEEKSQSFRLKQDLQKLMGGSPNPCRVKGN